MEIINLFKNSRKLLKYFFFLAVITVALIEFWLIHVPELWSWASELGQILSKLCMSYISAFIFYLLVTLYKSESDKKNLKPYVSKKVKKVIAAGVLLINSLSNETNIKLKNEFPDATELMEMLSKVRSYGQAPLMFSNMKQATWMEYLLFQKRESDNAMSKLLRLMPFLETKLTNILTDIDDCSYFNTIFIFAEARLDNQSLVFLASDMGNYFEKLNALKKFMN